MLDKIQHQSLSQCPRSLGHGRCIQIY